MSSWDTTVCVGPSSPSVFRILAIFFGIPALVLAGYLYLSKSGVVNYPKVDRKISLYTKKAEKTARIIKRKFSRLVAR